jgi:hypothetical protein
LPSRLFGWFDSVVRNQTAGFFFQDEKDFGLTLDPATTLTIFGVQLYRNQEAEFKV